MTQILQSEAAGAFGNSATDLITMRGYEEDVAAFTANAQNSQSPLLKSQLHPVALPSLTCRTL